MKNSGRRDRWVPKFICNFSMTEFMRNSKRLKSVINFKCLNETMEKILFFAYANVIAMYGLPNRLASIDTEKCFFR